MTRRFAEAHHITYPMLSDKGSVVIRKYGILNTNVPPDVTKFYGIPFPGQYMLAANGTVREKLFLPDFETRASASEVLLENFGTGVGNNTAIVTAQDVQAKVTLSDVRGFGGQRLGVLVDFSVAPGWHVYGEPLPTGYSPTSIKFDDDLVASQSLNFPKPTPVHFELLGETLPVYQGSFKALGDVLLKNKIAAGDHKLAGTLSFQECNDSICKLPQTVHFEIPIKVDTYVPPLAAK